MADTPTPYDAGRAAFAAGAAMDACPYPVDSDDAAAWLDGWDDAELEALGDDA